METGADAGQVLAPFFQLVPEARPLLHAEHPLRDGAGEESITTDKIIVH